MRLAAVIALAGDSPDAGIRTRVHNLPIHIEHPRGSVRILHNDKGKTVYKKLMMHDYGEIMHTKGRDGDPVDCMLGPMRDRAKEVYVVHMRDLGPDAKQREDEDKCMIGYPGADAAKAAFLSHYPESYFGGMTTLSVADFKKRLKQAQKKYTHNMLHAGGPGSGRHPGYADVLDSGKRIGHATYDRYQVFYKHTDGNVYKLNHHYKTLTEHGPETVFREKVHSGKVRAKLEAAKEKCPHCGSTKFALMPTDFETRKCSNCGRNWEKKKIHAERGQIWQC